MTSISVTGDAGVSLLAIDRPPANAMDVELLVELVAALESLAADPPPALVITGRPGFFSAGVDLKAAPTYGPDEQRQLVESINRMVLTGYGLPCPVVAAVTGHAIAGGLVLALCADVRVAATNGSYGLTEVKVGVPYPQAAIGLVRAELAPPAARRLVFGNELVDGQEAIGLGLFDEALQPGDVLSRAREVAHGLVEMPSAVYARTKRDLRQLTLDELHKAASDDPLLAGCR
jgi:enoyl-CoA hydratase